MSRYQISEFSASYDGHRLGISFLNFVSNLRLILELGTTSMPTKVLFLKSNLIFGQKVTIIFEAINLLRPRKKFNPKKPRKTLKIKTNEFPHKKSSGESPGNKLPIEATFLYKALLYKRG